MFAILLSEGMTPFYQNVSSFPTVIFTFFLLLCVVFWLVAMLGVIDIDILDLPEADAVDGSAVNGAALLVRWGLNGVPFVIVLSIISLIGWSISFYAVYFLHTASLNAIIAWPINIGIFIVAGYISIVLTAQIIKPIRKLFDQMSNDVQKQVLGQVAVVRTSRVDHKFGEAELNDGAAGLILKVRAFGDQQFKRNDKVVLLEYLEEFNAYRVVSEEEFLNN